jgi:uncharacterized membrane protein YeaQ/YmgE (transglycosylase-associated protein family)
MGVILFLLFGLVAGLIARAILPGRQSMGLLATTVVGCVGSLIGGFIGNLLSGRELFDLHAAGLIGSVLGALLVLVVIGASGRNRVGI